MPLVAFGFALAVQEVFVEKPMHRGGYPVSRVTLPTEPHRKCRQCQDIARHGRDGSGRRRVYPGV